MQKSESSLSFNIPVNLKLFNFILPALLLLFSMSLKAQGDLLIFPKRVVFEDGKKSEIINLTNIGKDTSTFNISFLQMRMKEDGSFEQITQPDTNQFFADPFIRFYPRTVTLAPNESQIVKLQLRKTNTLPPGEYRSHLYFRAERNQKPLGEKPVITDTTSVSVKLFPVFGITIANIIRIGKSNTTVSLSNLSLEKDEEGKPLMDITFKRTGNMSVYGSVLVNYISLSGKITKVGDVMGLAVYTPGTIRRFKIKLIQPEGVDFSEGKLSVIYSTLPDAKGTNLAKADLKLLELVSEKR